MPAKLDIVKSVTNLIVGAGASKIVHDIVKNNTDVGSSSDKMKIAAGSVVLGSMLAEHASTFAVAKVDEIATTIQEFRSRKEETE